MFKERVGSLCGSRVRVGGEGGRSGPKGLKWDTNELRVYAILCCVMFFFVVIFARGGGSMCWDGLLELVMCKTAQDSDNVET